MSQNLELEISLSLSLSLKNFRFFATQLATQKIQRMSLTVYHSHTVFLSLSIAYNRVSLCPILSPSHIYNHHSGFCFTLLCFPAPLGDLGGIKHQKKKVECEETVEEERENPKRKKKPISR